MRLSVSMEIDQLYPALLKKAGTLLKIRSSFPTQLNATVNYIENPLVLSSEIISIQHCGRLPNVLHRITFESNHYHDRHLLWLRIVLYRKPYIYLFLAIKKCIKWQIRLFISLYKIPLLCRLTSSLCGYNFLQRGQAIGLCKAHKPIIPATPCKAGIAYSYY